MGKDCVPSYSPSWCPWLALVVVVGHEDSRRRSFVRAVGVADGFVTSFASSGMSPWFDGLDPNSVSFRPQDLKDFGREAGSVSFADIDRDVPGQG